MTLESQPSRANEVLAPKAQLPLAGAEPIKLVGCMHAQSHGTACFSGSVKPAFLATYFGGIPGFIRQRPQQTRLLFSFPKHFLGCLPD